MAFYHPSIRSLAVIASIAALAVAGCDTADPSDGLIHGVSFEKDRTLIYEWSLASIDSLDTPFMQAEGRFATRITSTKDRVGELTDLVRMETFKVGNEDEKNVSWYRQTRSELRDLAYIVGSEVPIVQPKRNAEPIRPLSLYGLPRTVSILMNERSGKAGQVDSVHVRADPRIVFVYPLEEGATWTSFTSPFLQTREVLGYRDVKVKAGTFRCAEIRTRIPDLAPSMDWIDYVSEVGLVLRLVTHVRERRDPQNNPTGTFRSVERLELVSRGG